MISGGKLSKPKEAMACPEISCSKLYNREEFQDASWQVQRCSRGTGNGMLLTAGRQGARSFAATSPMWSSAKPLDPLLKKTLFNMSNNPDLSVTQRSSAGFDRATDQGRL
jgi:hypothetical protein